MVKGELTELAFDEATKATVASWVDEYGSTVARTAYYYIGDREAVQDIAQEVFLKCLTARLSPEQVRHPKAWLVRMTRNACIDWRRSKGRNASSSSTSSADLSAGDPTDGAADAMVLWEAVAELPALQQETLLLFYYFGFTTAEIAQVLRRRDGTVRSLLSRARTSLRMKLEDASDEGR